DDILLSFTKERTSLFVRKKRDDQKHICNRTVLDALNTNKTFRKIKENNMDKEIVIRRSKGAVPRAAVKTDFPCCLIENDELLDITFIKNSGNVPSKKKITGRLSFSNEPENIVTFNIKTKGGKKVKPLMKNNELKMKVDDVCVYAFKEDKLKAALQRDGRFIDSDSQNEVLNSEEILAILRDQHKDLLKTLKEREKLKDNSPVQMFFRAEYDKNVQSFSEVKKVKQLTRLSDSVCQIRVEGSARGTGFLLFDRFILTNAHVIGEFDPFTRKLSKTFTAVFGYEDLEARETKCVPVKEHVAAYYHGKINVDRHLDFALLELKDADEIADPSWIAHEGVKKIEPCFIIGKENLQEAADKHTSENANFIHVMRQQSLAEKWEMHDNQIIYNSCFFHGSSGSPVFDEDCYLIGVHTGGYAYKGENVKTRSIMEYAYSMQPILESIITQAKERERSDILKLLSEYKSFNLNLEDTDVDMEEEPQNQEDFI
uniref:Serine protease n=1 Tax=Sinocyclocheilus anshuiensis TaxID=1608454 RepID=A0A671Q5A6_9TELE